MSGIQKRAAGEILGGLAGLATRPFLGAARSKAIQSGIARGITRGVAAPIENAYQKSGLRKGVSWLAEQGARDVPHTPRLIMKQRSPAERAAFGQSAANIADKGVGMLAHNPETIPMQFVPVPGLTPGWMAAKAGVRKALGVPQMTTEMAMRPQVASYGPRATTQMDAVKIAKDTFYKYAQVDPYQQETQWSCSAACLKAVLEHYGISIREEECVEAIGARPGRGAEVFEIYQAARKLGFDAFHWLFDSIEQAKTVCLDKDMPIICDIQSFNYPGKGHYVVLVAADDENVQLMDPNTEGNQRSISREEMDDRWWDHTMAKPHKLMVKWGVVILPPEK